MGGHTLARHARMISHGLIFLISPAHRIREKGKREGEIRRAWRWAQFLAQRRKKKGKK